MPSYVGMVSLKDFSSSVLQSVVLYLGGFKAAQSTQKRKGHLLKTFKRGYVLISVFHFHYFGGNSLYLPHI